MPLPHILLAVLVALVWGCNFVAIRFGLDHYPPLLLSVLRFATASLPFLPFIGGPGVGWRWVLAIGFVLGVVYFALMFIGMDLGMPAGLTSAVMQTQAFFTMGFAALVLKERPDGRNLLGSAVAFLGVLLIAGDIGGGTLFAFVLIIASAACWGYANVLTRQAKAPDAFRLMVWMSAVPPLPLLALSLLVEGKDRVAGALMDVSLEGVGAVLYVAFGATILGFSLWSYLLKQHPASTVAPFSLLVPVFGLSSSALILGERPRLWQLAGVGLILVGLVVNSWPRRRHLPPAKAEA